MNPSDSCEPRNILDRFKSWIPSDMGSERKICRQKQNEILETLATSIWCDTLMKQSNPKPFIDTSTFPLEYVHIKPGKVSYGYGYICDNKESVEEILRKNSFIGERLGSYHDKQRHFSYYDIRDIRNKGVAYNPAWLNL